MIRGHGDDRYRYGRIRADFSSNVPGGVELQGLRGHLAARLELIGRYPEPEPYSLMRELAARHGLREGEVMVTNGATEAIYLAAHLTAGARSAVAEPAFAEYGDACRLYGHTLLHADDPCAPPAGTEALWCCNPNNPTGRTWERERLLEAIDRHPGVLFLIDQSYEDFTSRPVLSAREAADRTNVVLFHSLTKHFAIPGLRLGYLTASETLCEGLRRLRMPWSVNALAIEAGHYLLRNGTPGFDLELLRGEARRIARALEATGAFQTEPTDTHFFLARLLRGTAAELKERLAREEGILIRDASNFATLTPAHLRIAAQTPPENDLLIEAITRWTRLPH